MKYSYCLIILIFIGCSNSNGIKNNKISEIEIDVSKSVILDYSDSAHIIRCIPLETSEESVIREIEKIYITDSLVIIFDWKDVSVFNQEGNFIRKIGKKGNGPGEYNYLNDIFFDNKSGLIYLRDRLKKMLVYSLDGRLIDEKQTKIWFDSFCKIEGGYWLYSRYNVENPHGYTLRLVDDDFNEVAGFFPQKAFFATLDVSNFIQDEFGNNYYIYPYSNIIYKLSDHTPTPYLIINFGDKTMPYDKIRSLPNSQAYESLLSQNTYLGAIRRYIFCDQRFYFSFSGMAPRSTGYTARYDINRSSTVIYRSYSNFRPYEGLTFIEPIGTYKDLLIFTIQPDELPESTLKSLNLYNCYRENNVEANPILFFVKNMKK